MFITTLTGANVCSETHSKHCSNNIPVVPFRRRTLCQVSFCLCKQSIKQFFSKSIKADRHSSHYGRWGWLSKLPTCCVAWMSHGKPESKDTLHDFYPPSTRTRFPFLFSQHQLSPCVKQSGRPWHSAAGFSNQLFKFMLFGDTLLVEMWKENARSCGNFGCIFKLFLPTAWKSDSDIGEKHWRGVFFFSTSVIWHCFVQSLSAVGNQFASWWAPGTELSGYRPINLEEWVSLVSELTWFILSCLLWRNTNISPPLNFAPVALSPEHEKGQVSRENRRNSNGPYILKTSTLMTIL